jgi:hypothetical protein
MAAAKKPETPIVDKLKSDLGIDDDAAMPPAPPALIENGVPKIYQAINAITDALGHDGIAKEKTSKGVSFAYRGVDQVYAALNPLLVQHGVVILPRITLQNTVERMTKSGSALYFSFVNAEFDLICTIDGSKHTIATVGEAMDTSDKSVNKAMSVAYKYAVFLAFCVPIAGELVEDPDATGQTEIMPRGKAAPASKSAPANKAPELTEEEANTNYREAITLAEACTTVAQVKEVWEKRIKWDRIPTPWHTRLKKELQSIIAEIAKDAAPKSAPASEPPKREVAPAFDATGMDDDIPF